LFSLEEEEEILFCLTNGTIILEHRIIAFWVYRHLGRQTSSATTNWATLFCQEEEEEEGDDIFCVDQSLLRPIACPL